MQERSATRLEMPGRPLLQEEILRVRDAQIFARREERASVLFGAKRVVAHQQRHQARARDRAVEHILLTWPAQDMEIELAQTGMGGAGIGKLGEIEAVGFGRNGRDPGKPRAALEDRPDLAVEARPVAGRTHLPKAVSVDVRPGAEETDGGIEHGIEEGDEIHDLGRIGRRGDEHPGRLGFDRFPRGKHNGRAHRSVGSVVPPAVIVGVVGELGRLRR